MTRRKTLRNKNLPVTAPFVASGHILKAAEFFNHKKSLLIASPDSSPKRQIDVAKCFQKVAKRAALAKL
ncbi:hypothetical protein [Cronobacter dublinensis]|uniref:hypothetical protein n=1 Tax=Cronobacter dublinensis TaxID=413497 RepID=UPI001319C2D5|nr:hypothetical protein [Cronobacter dublinensis]